MVALTKPTHGNRAEAQSRKHLPALDGIRGLAVLIVLAYHTGGGAQSSNFAVRTFGLALKAGWGGVTLFFVLSGFLITGILWDSKGSSHWWRNFYVRRLLRISPLYYGAILLVFVVSYFMHQRTVRPTGLWVYALYLQNVPGVHGPRITFRELDLLHFWSLAVEEQFYLLWPWLLWRLKSIAQVKHLCVAVFLGSALFRFGIAVYPPHIGDYTTFIFSRAGELALGGYLAMCFRDHSWERLQRLAPYLTPLFLVGFVVACIPGHTLQLAVRDWRNFSVALAFLTLFFGGLIVLSLREGVVNRMMSAAWLRWVGGISYGIYVYHGLFHPFYVWLTDRIAPNAGKIESLAIIGAITWVLSIVVAWLSYRYFEEPILRLRKYFPSRPEQRRTTGSVEPKPVKT